MDKEKVKKVLKNRFFIGGVCLFIGILLTSGSGMTEEQKKILADNPSMTEEVKTLKSESQSLKSENENLKSENVKLSGKVEFAKPWFDMNEEQQKELEKKNEEEKKAKADEEARLKAEKEAEEKAQKEADEQAKKEAEAHKYETGITYEDLARNPKDNEGKLVTFNGKIIQVMKGDGYTQYRMNIDSDYDKTVLIQVSDTLLKNGNILEDDVITVRGMFLGEQSYQTVLKATKTIPSIVVNEVDY